MLLLSRYCSASRLPERSFLASEVRMQPPFAGRLSASYLTRSVGTRPLWFAFRLET